MWRIGLALLGLTFAVSPLSADKPDERFTGMDAAIQASIERHELPGAVVLILHKGEVVYRKAYGSRSVQPVVVPMTTDTVFDLASLTKPIATATSIMLLVERGKLNVTDCVAQHWPEFGRNGKDKLTVEDLLLHTSGLIADNSLSDYQDGKSKALERICDLTPTAASGAKFVYSDVNYIVLGELVGRISGQSLADFARANIFQPLGMNETGFLPPDSLTKRTAATEQRAGRWMVGEVHDPRSYLLGGVAGHAGLFSTADDLAIFARTLLGHGNQILRSETLQLMTTPRPIPGGFRAYGWDVDTRFSSNRGDVFPRGKSFGHTGFTGTSIWIDPTSDTAVIFLSNRVHPDGKGNVNKLRGQVATIAATALGVRPAAVGPGAENRPPTAESRQPTLTGIDVLVRENFARLKGRRIGLVTNHTGVDRRGRATIDLLHKAEGVTLVALFSPEHGIRGAVDEKVADGRDEKTGLPIYSLYGTRRKPTAETLKDVDTLVYDIQDAGCRFYTYISTLGLILEAGAENKVRVVVLDRPNPIGGLAVEGPVLDAGRESFVGWHTLPVRHGMTVGELARMFNAERKIGADLEVIKMEGWRRGDFYDRTGLTWINPSPNLRSLTQAFLYPGVGLLETTNLSVGRGTDRPFEWVGAPWLDGVRFADVLNEQRLPGVRFVPVNLTPTSSVFAKARCRGVQIIIDDWAKFQPLHTGITMACALRRLFPNEWQVEKYDRLLVHKATWEALQRGATAAELEKAWVAELERFNARRREFLIYSE